MKETVAEACVPSLRFFLEARGAEKPRPLGSVSLHFPFRLDYPGKWDCNVAAIAIVTELERCHATLEGVSCWVPGKSQDVREKKRSWLDSSRGQIS